MKHVTLPSGGQARVSEDIAPETLEALDQMCRAATKEFNARIDRAAVTGEIDPPRNVLTEKDI